MAKSIKQYYLTAFDEDSFEAYASGNFLGGKSVVQLGIQTLPGVEFTTNNSSECVTIGQTGIYELELADDVTITSIKFTTRSRQLLADAINGYLIIDIIYLDGTAVSEV